MFVHEHVQETKQSSFFFDREELDCFVVMLPRRRGRITPRNDRDGEYFQTKQNRGALGPIDTISFLLYCYIMQWAVETLNPVVDAEIGALPADMRARLVRLSEIISQVGLDALPRDSVKHLEGSLWELRITGRDGISRAIYVTAQRRRIVIVRVFIKKTQKTPPRELALARQRAKDVR